MSIDLVLHQVCGLLNAAPENLVGVLKDSSEALAADRDLASTCPLTDHHRIDGGDVAARVTIEADGSGFVLLNASIEGRTCIPSSSLCSDRSLSAGDVRVLCVCMPG